MNTGVRKGIRTTVECGEGSGSMKEKEEEAFKISPEGSRIPEQRPEVHCQVLFDSNPDSSSVCSRLCECLCTHLCLCFVF